MRNRWVTTKKAKKILEKLGPWLNKRPPLRKFTDRLNPTVETIWPLPRIAAHYMALDGAITQLRRALPAVKFHLRAMEVAAIEPEIVPFVELLKLDDVRRILGSVNDLELTLTHIPNAFGGTADKRKRGTKPKDWYVGLVRDLVEVAREIGIPFSTDCNGAAAEQHLTALATLVHEVEGLLPKEVRSNSTPVSHGRNQAMTVTDLPAVYDPGKSLRRRRKRPFGTWPKAKCRRFPGVRSGAFENSDFRTTIPKAGSPPPGWNSGGRGRREPAAGSDRVI